MAEEEHVAGTDCQSDCRNRVKNRYREVRSKENRCQGWLGSFLFLLEFGLSDEEVLTAEGAADV
jgi:hypothetical protein